ncbi:MAG: hypothetical protein F9K30_23345, partial [Dechloromonas sp.]
SAGNDLFPFQSQGGNDTVHGNAGNDRLELGAGRDTAYAGDDDAQTLAAAIRNGEAGEGVGEADLLAGGGGDDTLIGGTGGDIAQAGSGACGSGYAIRHIDVAFERPEAARFASRTRVIKPAVPANQTPWRETA